MVLNKASDVAPIVCENDSERIQSRIEDMLTAAAGKGFSLRSAGPTGQQRRIRRRRRPPRSQRRFERMEKAHFCQAAIARPEPFLEAQDDANHGTHLKAFDSREFLLYRRSEDDSMRMVRWKFQHAQRQRNDGTRPVPLFCGRRNLNFAATP